MNRSSEIRSRPKMSARAKLPANAMPTRIASSLKRVLTTSAPVGPWSVCRPTISENRPKATSAASVASFSAPASESFWVAAWLLTAGPRSHLLDFRTAEDAGRQEDQYHDQDREGGDVLVFDREVGRPERLDQADQQTAKHGARQGANAAEHGGGEGFDAGDEADEEIDHAVIEQIHDAGDRGERRPDHEGERNRAVDIDADERRHLQILLAGAHVAAEPRLRHQPGEHRHQRQRGDDDNDLDVGELHRKTLA